MAINQRKLEANKINLLVDKISDIFGVRSDNILRKSIDETCFEINFAYEDMLIRCYVNEDNFHNRYQYLEIKKQFEKHIFNWTPFGLLLAYFDNKSFDMRVDIEYSLKCLLRLKDYMRESFEIKYFQPHKIKQKTKSV